MLPILTVVICTYNRAELLSECLDAIENQNVCPELYNVIIIDNNSSDHTKEIAKKYCHQNFNFKYFTERNQGLSYARNKAADVARTEWFAFLDDDGLAHSNFVEACLDVIESDMFDCFGGIYYPWYKYGKPKWLPSSFGAKQPLSDQVILIDKPQLDGGIFAIRRDSLIAVGGFPTDLGMSGNQIAYGEETQLQINLLTNGFRLGFTPFWKMDHLVAKYKLSVWWHLRAEYAKGRDSMKIEKKNPVCWTSFDKFKFVVYILLTQTIRSVKKLLRKDYYFQNMVFDVFSPIFFRFGQQSNNS